MHVCCWAGLGREPAVFVGAQQTVRSYRRCRINRVEHWRSRERWRRGPAASVIVEFVRRAVRTENSSGVFVVCWRPTRAGRLWARMFIGLGIVLRGRAKTRRSSAVVTRPMRRRLLETGRDGRVTVGNCFRVGAMLAEVIVDNHRATAAVVAVMPVDGAVVAVMVTAAEAVVGIRVAVGATTGLATTRTRATSGDVRTPGSMN